MARSARSVKAGSLDYWSNKVFMATRSRGTNLFDEKTKSGSSKRNGEGGSLKQTPEQAYVSLANAGIGSLPVLFKVISTIHSTRGIGQLMEYLNKEESVALESSLGIEVIKADDVKSLAASWEQDFERESTIGKNHKKNHRFLYHTVVSFPRDLNGEHALAITRNVMHKELGPRGVDWVSAGHFNEDGHNPHVHVAFKAKKLDGTKIIIDKEMIFNFRRAIAQEAKDYGLNLHHGMSWERGMYSQGMSRAEYESGKSQQPERVNEKSKELLSNQINGLKEYVLGASNRNKDVDKIVFKQLRAITKRVEMAKSHVLHLEQDVGPEL